MMKERVVSVLLMYGDTLSQHGFTPERHTSEELPTGKQRGQHLAWMCVEAVKIAEEDRTEKAMRWLDFIQGALWADGYRSVEDMKKDNKPPGEEFDGSRV